MTSFQYIKGLCRLAKKVGSTHVETFPNAPWRLRAKIYRKDGSFMVAVVSDLDGKWYIDEDSFLPY
jgi:hypothetical protein